MGSLNFLGSYRFWDAGSNKSSTTLTFLSFLDAYRLEDKLFERIFAYLCEKGKSLESFFEQIKIGGEYYFFTLEQPYPDFAELKRTPAILVKNNEYKILIKLYL